MTLNARVKGAVGEREVISILEPVVRRVLEAGGYPVPTGPILQRNQNQSAVGGSDLTNTFGLAIEVKRQETLAVEQWWRQCTASAERNAEVPVLMYRQNQKKWRVVAMVDAPLPIAEGKPMSLRVRAEMSLDDFLRWFEHHVGNMMAKGYSYVV